MSLLDNYGSIANSYKTLVTYYVPGPQSLSYFVAPILTFVALAIPPSILPHRYHVYLVLPICYAATIHAWIAMHGLDVISVDVLLWSTYMLGFKDPRRDFKRLWRLTADEATHKGGLELVQLDPTSSTNSQNGQSPEETKRKSHNTANNTKQQNDSAIQIYAQPYSTALIPRLNWVGTLLISTRLHRWLTTNHYHDLEQLRHASHPPPTRIQFLTRLLPPLFLDLFLVAPLITQLYRHDPYFSTTSTSLTSPFPPNTSTTPFTIALLHHLIPPPLLRTLTLGLYAHHALTIGFLLPCPLVVSLNYLTRSTLPPSTWSPHTLPPYFGPFATVLDHGLAGLWGRWWHQHVRIMAAGPGDALADALGCANKGKPRWVLRVASAFAFSGLTHVGLVPPGLENAAALRWRIWLFFCAQGLGILVEGLLADGFAAAAAVVKGRGESRRARGVVMTMARRGVILAWVLANLCVTIPLLRDPFRDLGWWRLYPPPEGWFPEWLQGALDGRWIP